MFVVNEKDLKRKSFSAHGGKGVMDIGFAFEEFQRFQSNNDTGWLFFGIAEFRPGVTAGLHKHEGNDEFFYILSGQAIMTVDGEDRLVRKGDIILTRSGSTHGIKKVIRKLKFITIEILRTK